MQVKKSNVTLYISIDIASKVRHNSFFNIIISYFVVSARAECFWHSRKIQYIYIYRNKELIFQRAAWLKSV